MPPYPEEIESLPSETRSKLRSTQILTSIPQIISELVQNSLDANAKHVDIGINREEWTFYVKDDGHGMSKEDMRILSKGGEEGRYGSSKTYQKAPYNAQSQFGFRGEALASAGDICSLEISSRTIKSKESWSLMLKGGKQIYYGPAVRWRSDYPGTVVCIREAFYNVPVRRLSHPPAAKTLELIRKEIETYALMFPHVAFTLDDTSKGFELGPSSSCRVMTVPKTASTLACFKHLFGTALVGRAEVVQHSTDGVVVDGFIGVEGSRSKAYQFLYVNKHPIRYCEIHKTINTLFSNSSFTKLATDEVGEDSLPATGSRRSPRKSERKPIYCLNISLPLESVDNCIEPAKNAVQLQNEFAMIKAVSEVIRDFLTKHRYLVLAKERVADGREDSESPIPHKRRKLTRSPVDPLEPEETEGSMAFLEGNGGTSHNTCIVYPGEDDQEDFTWTNPKTGECFVIDAKSGNSYPVNHPIRSEDSACGGRNGRTIVDTSHLRKQAKKGTGGDDEAMPEWIAEALQSNSTFTSSERDITATGAKAAAEGSMTPKLRVLDLLQSDAVSSRFLRQRFSADDLKEAQVISQVDRKFVACLVRDDQDMSLVLVDQHAADERIRVERILKQLCDEWSAGKVSRRDLDPPKRVVLTDRENYLMQSSNGTGRRYLTSWGIDVKDVDPDASRSQSGLCQAEVTAVPEIIADKLMVGLELQQLIRGLLSAIEDGEAFVPNTQASETWLSTLRHCPKDIIELINSKACRGAIMFNDAMTTMRCEKLVAQLSETAFPFQCAHGRPSIVPLVSLDGLKRRTKAAIDWRAFMDNDEL